MKPMLPSVNLPLLSDEALAGLPDEARALVGVLQRVVEQYRDAVGELEKALAASEKERQALAELVEEQKRRLGQDSSNSSRPPSSDMPGSGSKKKKDKKDKKESRKRGPRFGHKGSRRQLLPLDQVDHLHGEYPTMCRSCGASLVPSQGDVKRRPQVWQQVDIVDGRRVVHQYNLFRLRCASCRVRTRAALPDGVEASAFGPGCRAVVVLLHGRYKLSRRDVCSAMAELYGVTISPGTVDTICQQASRALEDPVEGVKKAIRESDYIAMDETGWRLRAALCYLWAMVTPVAVYFEIGSRKREVATNLLGDFKGVLGSDRYAVYLKVHDGLRQVCWAHLIRDFTGSAERGGKAGELGRWALREAAGLFAAWHAFKEDDGITRQDLREAVGPIRMRMRRLINQGAKIKGKGGALYRSLRDKHWDALFTFIDVEGIEPTNNAAERALRPAVLWRRASLGSQSDAGTTFVGRILTAVETLKRQGRSVKGYLAAVFEAAAHRQTSPPLLPP